MTPIAQREVEWVLVKIIQDVWILMNGIPLFKRVYDERLNSELFAGFMSALKMLGDQMSSNQSGLNNFQVGEKRFFVIRREPLLFVVNGDLRVKSKKIEKELSNLVDIFLEDYPLEDIKAWDGNVAKFEEFRAKIEESLDDPLSIMKTQFWA